MAKYERYELDFLSPDGSSIMFEITIQSSNDEKIREERVRKEMTPILLSHYLNLLLTVYSIDELLILYNNNVEVGRETLEKIVWKKDKPKYKCLSSIKSRETSCMGCLCEYANQLGHMDKGGCLYDSL